jgi:hypothetical protein
MIVRPTVEYVVPLLEVDLVTRPTLVSSTSGPVPGAWASRRDGDPVVAWFDLTTFVGPYSVSVLEDPFLVVQYAHGFGSLQLSLPTIHPQPCTLIQVELAAQ